MPWLQLKITSTPNDAADIEAALLDNGALSVTLQDNADEPIYEPSIGETPLWQNTRITGLFDAGVDTASLEHQIRRQCECVLSCRWELLEDKDWQREWLSHFKPIQCGEKFWVCPSTCEKPDENAINLILDPGLAFGTGTHATTFMCLQWIATACCDGKTIIDYGCGSGILGIAALLHGAASAVGIDIDPQALLATSENVKRNKLDQHAFCAHLPHENSPAPGDIVLANILAGPLVELTPKLIALTKPGGKLCLSGILAVQQEPVLNAYRHAIEIDHIFERDEWVCIVGSKKPKSLD